MSSLPNTCTNVVLEPDAVKIASPVLRGGWASNGLSLPSLDDMPTYSTSPLAASPEALAAAPLPSSYEQALGELERLVADMEAGQLPLDRLLEGYRRGAELLTFCRGRLDAVDAQVKVLEDGQLRPWTES